MNNITCGLSTSAGNLLTFLFAVRNNRPVPIIGRAGKRPEITVSNPLELLRGDEKYFRSEVANLPKILNGPKGNMASKTVASVEMLNGCENLHGVRLPKKLSKCSKRWL